MMLERVISGGQTGADQGGLLAAMAFGIPTGGYAPRGWLTEIGSAPWLAEFGLIECPEPAWERPAEMPDWQWNGILYTSRTKRNAKESDATLWFEFPGQDPRGLLATRKHARSFIGVTKGDSTSTTSTPSGLVEHFGGMLTGTLNIAGNRESKSRGINAWVRDYLAEAFRLLAASQSS
jgi:hypothetical protein